ncbi:MAG: hypothetical protein JOZ78_26845, partial [Chroococcidiopsidaceae cyanobacterium CP_BM_ER_R8_30]|nr:hypothetical protein [Chroococcidiopsidaceae cyanobacterium CP_BM_ER_R8_30]
MNLKRDNLLRLFVAFSIAAMILLMSTAVDRPIALGQLPSLTAPSGTQPLPIGVKRHGTLESTEVYLDGQELFRIASPTVLNRSALGSQVPVEVRAKHIEANLKQLVTGNKFSDETVLDPKTLEVAIETINGQPVLFVKDATQTEAKVLLTVTEADAQYASTSKERLAERWQEILERELRQALELRQPRALQRQIFTVVKVLVATVLLTLVLGATWVLFKRREQRLEQQLAAESTLIDTQELTSVEPSTTESEPRLFQGLRHHFGLQKRLQIVLFLRWLLFWVIAFAWIIAIAYSLYGFPQTRQFAKRIIAIPIVILMTWFLTGLVNRLTDFGIGLFIQSWQQDKSLTKANLQRIATVTNVVKGLKTVLVYGVAILWVLQWLHLAPASILTLG